MARLLSAFQETSGSDLSLIDVIEPNGNAGRRKAAKQTLRPIAPYDPDPCKAARACFDRESGLAISADQLKTYAQALSGYHLRPKSKFEYGDYYDRGPTRRRHIRVIRVEYIGKESNRLEQQYFLGLDEGGTSLRPEPERAQHPCCRTEIACRRIRRAGRREADQRFTQHPTANSQRRKSSAVAAHAPADCCGSSCAEDRSL